VTEPRLRPADSACSIEETLLPPTPKLEDELAEVSGTLTATVGRLREISAKAEAFEAEVQELVKRADAAQAAADLSEEQAQPAHRGLVVIGGHCPTRGQRTGMAGWSAYRTFGVGNRGESIVAFRAVPCPCFDVRTGRAGLDRWPGPVDGGVAGAVDGG
jgi:hypothetical protein